MERQYHKRLYVKIYFVMATKKKNAAAVELGRRGGEKKVPKGFSTMDPERRKEIAKEAIAKRWATAKKKKAPK